MATLLLQKGGVLIINPRPEAKGRKMDDMTLKEAIDARISRRTYIDAPLESKTVERLEAVIRDINGQSGLNIQLVQNVGRAFGKLSRSYGMFSGVNSFFAMVGEDDGALLERVGYYGEKLVLEATRMGLGTCWVGGTFDRNGCECRIEENQKLALVITVGRAAAAKSPKEALIYKLIHRPTKPLEAMYSAKDAVPDWFIEGMAGVQKAPSALNAQPVTFSYQKNKVTAGVSNMNSHQAVDLGIAKLHFEIYSGHALE